MSLGWFCECLHGRHSQKLKILKREGNKAKLYNSKQIGKKGGIKDIINNLMQIKGILLHEFNLRYLIVVLKAFQKFKQFT